MPVGLSMQDHLLTSVRRQRLGVAVQDDMHLSNCWAASLGSTPGNASHQPDLIKSEVTSMHLTLVVVQRGAFENLAWLFAGLCMHQGVSARKSSLPDCMQIMQHTSLTRLNICMTDLSDVAQQILSAQAEIRPWQCFIGAVKGQDICGISPCSEVEHRT